MRKNRTLSAIVLALASALAIPAAAAEGPVLFDETAANRIPEVYVTLVELDQRFYGAGAAVKGQATVSNPSEYPALVVFELAIVGEFADDGLPRKVYATADGGQEISLAAGQSKTVPFEIASPLGLDGSGFSVEVFSRLAGSVRRGWEYSPTFTIEGDGGYVEVSEARFVAADGRRYWPTEGPFVYPDEGGSLSLAVALGGGTSAVQLTPVVTVSERAVGEPSVRREPPVTVPAGGSANVALSFGSGQTPGVYEGEVSWLDASGAERASRLPFRYIVAGESATVHGVSVSAESVSRGDPVSVTVAVSGNPLDLQRDPGGAPPTAPASRVLVRVVGPSGELVAEGEQELVLPVIGDLEFPLVAERDAATLRAEVLVYGSKGQTLYARVFPLLGGPGAADAPVSSAGDGSPWLGWSLVGLAVLGLAGVASAARRGRLAAALVLSLVALAAWLLASRDLQAFHYTSTTSDRWCGPSSIFVQHPQDGGTVACGESLNIVGSVDYYYCTNSGGSGSANVWVERQKTDGTWEQIIAPQSVASFYAAKTGGHGHPTARGMFSVPTDRTTRAGTYRVWVSASSNTACASAATGYSEFTVTGCDRCPNLAGDQNAVPPGMTVDVGGSCNCPSGSTFDAASGRCEDDNGNCTTCGTSTGGPGSGVSGGGRCPAGTKYCDGACISETETCDLVVVDSCVFVPEGDQYCVEIFDRNGNRTEQFAEYDMADLEEMFGFGLREALFAQRAGLDVGGASYPVWGVVGRVISGAGGIDANYGSAGCAGALCAYGEQGCLTTTDPQTNKPVGNCCPVNDATGGGKEPTAIITVEPSVVGQGGQCRVYWSSHEMSTCRVSGQGVSSTALAGLASTAPLDESATYTLTCTGLDGLTYEDVDTCTVDPDAIEF